MNYRRIHIILTFLLLGISALIAFYSRELGSIRGYIGDVVIVMFLYSLVRTFHDIGRMYTFLGVVIFAYLIEWLQYLDILDILHIRGNTILKLALGSVFDPYDLIAYTVGWILIFLIDWYIIQKIFPRS